MSGREPLAENQVHIWYRLTESLEEQDVDQSLARLSDAERLRHDRHRIAADRRDFAVAHALLRSSLSRYGDAEPHEWAFSAGPLGKPGLAVECGRPSALSFSLSHTRGCVACAIARGTAVGIDVERTDVSFDFAAVASLYFDAEERSQLERCPLEKRAARFIELWTLKEARGKAMGTGLSDAGIDREPWQLAAFAVRPHYRLGVAIAPGHTEPLTITARNLDDWSEPRGHRPV